ncbi:unnamed protein product [Calicophoron daubneyi]|uniref:Ribosomal RNA-processing protein 8 n=1 Tax=Calicophoron daubneyi TaxID=300641 RepID=A0AAV2TI16_CALDB
MRKADIRNLRRIIGASDKNGSHKSSKRKKEARRRRLTNTVEVVADVRNSFDTMIKSSIFRFLNEKLYSCSSAEALSLFTNDRKAFDIYHSGFQRQLSQWPDDPQQWIRSYLNQSCEGLTKKVRIADLGCGDARLSNLLDNRFKIYSFDLIAVNERVTACDMAHTPLKSSHVHFAVFCLSLMGTNCRDFIYEANRILKLNGELIIVDVASRFEGKFQSFLKKLRSYGFAVEFSETTQDTYFIRARLRKVEDCTHETVERLPPLHLKPCVYKKR